MDINSTTPASFITGSSHTKLHTCTMSDTHPQGRRQLEITAFLIFCVCVRMYMWKIGFLLSFILPWIWKGASPESPCMSCPALQSQPSPGALPAAFIGCDLTEDLQSHQASVPGLHLSNVSLQPGVGPASCLASLTQTDTEKGTCTSQTSTSERMIPCIEYRIDH